MEKLLGLVSANKTPIPLKGIDVKVNIVGTVAEVQSSLTYMNEEDSPIEASFTFPVDDGSAVYRFEAEIQGRKIVAEIQEREQAKLTYNDSLAEGKTAALLKQDDNAADVFQCMLGNLPAQAEATLVFAYVIELPQEADGKLRFTLPTILNPRYSPDAGSTVAAEGATYTPPCKVPYTFTFSADIHGYHKVSSVTSAGLNLKVEMSENDHHARVTLGEEFKFDRDLDLLVLYEKCFEPQIVMEVGKSEAEGLFQQDLLMLSFRPDLKEVSMATSGEYIFVIDRSGSMHGDKIKNAKEALLLFLKSLPADCYFNIISFGSSFKALFSSSSKKYSEAALKEATNLQEKMEADMGGTEILQPLKHAYGQKAIPGHPRSMFILTDGEVGNTDQIIGLVKKHAASVRVFALGVGHGASTSLVNGIARAGNGKAEFIADNSRVQPKVISLLKCSMQPAITNVELLWDLPPDVTTMLIPETPPMIVTAGERLTLYALMQGVDHHTIYGASSLTLKGILGSQPVSYTLPFTLNDETKSFSPTSSAHRLATKAQIKILEDEEASNIEDCLSGNYFRSPEEKLDTLRNKIISLSRHGNIVSKMTAFVAVDKEGEKIEGTMVERACPVPTLDQTYMEAMNRSSLKCYSLCASGLADLDRSSSISRCADLMDREMSVQSASLDLCYAMKTGAKKKSKGGGGIFSLLSCTGKKKSRKSDSSAYAPPPASAPSANQAEVGELEEDDEQMEACGAMDEVTDLTDEMDDDEGCEDSSNNMDKSDQTADEVKGSGTKHVDDKRMMAVIAEQKLQGNWELTKKLADLLQLSQDKIKASVTIQDDSVICTLAVLAWLAKNFSKRREEWQIIEAKAVSWLEKQSLSNRSVSDLLAECTNTLWT